MQIERGASNTFALLGRPILSPSYWLLWFRDPERNASVYCIATASNTTGGMLTLTFTETNNPTALNGQVKLSPRGNWELKVYEQTSATNLDPASAGRLVKTIGILVVGDAAVDTGWSGTACPPGGGGDCDPLTYTVYNTEGTAIITGSQANPCGSNVELTAQNGSAVLKDTAGTTLSTTAIPATTTKNITAPDATVTFDGQPLVTVPSGGTDNIDCSTLLDAAYVEDGGAVTGSYVITGTLNARSVYTLDVDHSLRYSGTRWELVKPGVDYQAAVGSQTYPWLADWSATPATVTQGTVGTVCQGPLIPCDPMTVTLAGVEIVNEADPCGVDVALACDDTVDAVWVEGAGVEAANGLYVRNGTENGLPRYELPNGYHIHSINAAPDYSWYIETPLDGSVYQGVSYVQFPWNEEWEASEVEFEPVPTVRQATIGDICATPCECEDVTVQLRDTAGNNIGSPDVYAAGTSTTKTAPDGSVTINNSVPTTLHTVAVRSNGNATQAIADSTITRPDGTTEGLPATVALDVRDYRSGILYLGGKNNWSGQTTVYRTGDEGTAYADGLFNFTDPSYPTHASRLTDFLTLAANNIHGNTLRFTDRAGSAPATTGNRFIQDHSTGWEYYRLGTLSSALWNAQVDAGVALNATLGETGWVLCPIDLLELISDRSLGTGCLNYGGWLMGTSGAVWSSTTMLSSTTAAFSFFIDNQRPANQLKASVSNVALFCRRFAA